MIYGYKEFKAHPIIKKIKYADVSEVLEGEIMMEINCY